MAKYCPLPSQREDWWYCNRLFPVMVGTRQPFPWRKCNSARVPQRKYLETNIYFKDTFTHTKKIEKLLTDIIIEAFGKRTILKGLNGGQQVNWLQKREPGYRETIGLKTEDQKLAGRICWRKDMLGKIKKVLYTYQKFFAWSDKGCSRNLWKHWGFTRVSSGS